MFEVLEHTADIGFRARAASLPELFENAAEALASIAAEIEDAAPRETYPLEAEGADLESLLVNWLSEVLFKLDGERLALRSFHVCEVAAGRAAGEARGEPRDPARHRAKLIVKGVTYHQLEIARAGDEWRCQVFLDV